MFSLCRTASTQISRPLTRSFAEIVVANPPGLQIQPSSSSDVINEPRKRRRPRVPAPSKPATNDTKVGNRVPVREDHGLYAFFRRNVGDNLVGDDRFQVVESPEDAQVVTGRAWEAAELRNKNFKDLHTLWYVALREKNLLSTQKEEARRMGVQNSDLQVSMEKVRHCRKTMARIKLVLNERRLAYEGAMKIVEKKLAAKEPPSYDHADKRVLKYQLSEKRGEEIKEKTKTDTSTKEAPASEVEGSTVTI